MNHCSFLRLVHGNQIVLPPDRQPSMDKRQPAFGSCWWLPSLSSNHPSDNPCWCSFQGRHLRQFYNQLTLANIRAMGRPVSGFRKCKRNS